LKQLLEAQNKDARRAPEVLHSSADSTEAPPRTVAVFVKASAKHLQHVLEGKRFCLHCILGHPEVSCRLALISVLLCSQSERKFWQPDFTTSPACALHMLWQKSS